MIAASDLAEALVATGTVEALQTAWSTGDTIGASTHGTASDTSRFALASLTKPLVAVACLVACEEGALELDESLSRYLPRAACTATLRELLSHASGLAFDDATARRIQTDPNAGWAEVAAAYTSVAPIVPARERRTYSNTGYALIAAALEQATRLPYQVYIDEAVLQPLGMTHTQFGASPDDQSIIAVQEPGLLGHGEQLFNGARFRALGLPQSGAYGTASDYLRLLRCVRHGGKPLLAKQTNAFLLANQCGALPGGVGEFMEWDVCDWAVGFECRDGKQPHWTGTALSASAITHFGASGTLALFDPVADVAAVVLANRGTYSGWMLEPGGWPDLCAALVA